MFISSIPYGYGENLIERKEFILYATCFLTNYEMVLKISKVKTTFSPLYEILEKKTSNKIILEFNIINTN